MDLAGKTVLVTGATSGIGLETAVHLAGLGAQVVMVGRDPARTQAAVSEVRRRAISTTVDSLLCDFSSQRQIRSLATTFVQTHERLHVLVNNAGTVFAKRTLTEDGIEATFAVNHLGYFLLTSLLLDVLKKSAPARVVNVASISHYRGTLDFADLGFAQGYGVLKAYERSKLANVLFTRELARRLQSTRVTVNCMHPGMVATQIWTHAPGWAKPLVGLLRLFMLSPTQGAETLIYLAASSEVEGKTGLYYDKKKARTPSALARDDALALRLWQESARLVGVPAA